jgi:hypothetical protein
VRATRIESAGSHRGDALPRKHESRLQGTSYDLAGGPTIYCLSALGLLVLGVFNLATSWVVSWITWVALAVGGAGFIACVVARVRQPPGRGRIEDTAMRAPRTRPPYLRLLVESAVVTVIGLYASVTVTSGRAWVAVVLGLLLAMAIIEFFAGVWQDRRERSVTGNDRPR